MIKNKTIPILMIFVFLLSFMAYAENEIVSITYPISESRASTGNTFIDWLVNLFNPTISRTASFPLWCERDCNTMIPAGTTAPKGTTCWSSQSICKSKTGGTTPTSSPQPTSTPTCTDSDGTNIYNKGYIMIDGNRQDDFCYDSNTLIENTCENGIAYGRMRSCDNGCNDGICVVQPSPTSTPTPSIQYINPSITVKNGKIIGTITLKNTGDYMKASDTYLVEMQVRKQNEGFMAFISPDIKTCDTNYPNNIHRTFTLAKDEIRTINLETAVLTEDTYKAAFFLATKCYNKDYPNENRIVPGQSDYGPFGTQENLVIITITTQKCSDGTSYGECSTTKPLYCDNGNFVNKASKCECPENYNVVGENCELVPTTKADLQITSMEITQGGLAKQNEFNSNQELKVRVYVKNYGTEIGNAHVETAIVKRTLVPIRYAIPTSRGSNWVLFAETCAQEKLECKINPNCERFVSAGYLQEVEPGKTESTAITSIFYTPTDLLTLQIPNKDSIFLDKINNYDSGGLYTVIAYLYDSCGGNSYSLFKRDITIKSGDCTQTNWKCHDTENKIVRTKTDCSIEEKSCETDEFCSEGSCTEISKYTCESSGYECFDAKPIGYEEVNNTCEDGKCYKPEGSKNECADANKNYACQPKSCITNYKQIDLKCLKSDDVCCEAQEIICKEDKDCAKEYTCKNKEKITIGECKGILTKKCEYPSDPEKNCPTGECGSLNDNQCMSSKKCTLIEIGEIKFGDINIATLTNCIPKIEPLIVEDLEDISGEELAEHGCQKDKDCTNLNCVSLETLDKKGYYKKKTFMQKISDAVPEKINQQTIIGSSIKGVLTGVLTGIVSTFYEEKQLTGICFEEPASIMEQYYDWMNTTFGLNKNEAIIAGIIVIFIFLIIISKLMK